jgi:hypothetical protein
MNARLASVLRSTPSRTEEDSRSWVQFAVRCLRETPVGPTQTAWDLVADKTLRGGVEAAERWYDGKAKFQEIQNAADASLSAAAQSAGTRLTSVVGRDAAAWSAAHVVLAAASAARIGHESPMMVAIAGAGEDAAADAATNAVLASDFARRAAEEGHEQAAIQAQAEMVRSIWHKPQ